MNEKTNKRSGMLSTIYNMLPEINDDYAAQLVYTLENKKTIAQLSQDIADITAQLSSDSPMTDTLVAKILLDEITLPAALRQLHVHNNSLSISELCTALEVPPEQTEQLQKVYASFSTRQHFDEAFAHALEKLPPKTYHTDAQKAAAALEILLKKATGLLERSTKTVKQNKKEILHLADQYHLSFTLTAGLLDLYTQPASIAAAAEMKQLIKQLSNINKDKFLCASLAARCLLWQLTPKDAHETAQTAQLLDGRLMEEDLRIIACRYLKAKSPAEIASTFQAVMDRLPHVSQPEENLSLAVRVLVEGTEESLQQAMKEAALQRERKILRRNLSKKELYNGYEYELAQRFGGKKTLVQLEREMHDLLDALPYCVDKAENKELACKVLLGTHSREEAEKQAKYLRDLKAQTLTQGLAPELMKSYLGTKPAEEILHFFETSLAPFTFWKSNRDKHVFALHTLVGELNGTYNRRISQFVLESLEDGSSLELMTDMLSTIQTHKTSDKELDNLLKMYRQARASSKL